MDKLKMSLVGTCCLMLAACGGGSNELFGAGGGGLGGDLPPAGITGGSPDNDSLSPSATRLSIDGRCDGEFTDVSIRVADKNNNPAPRGTVVNFFTSAGKIARQCVIQTPTSTVDVPGDGDEDAGEDGGTVEPGVCTTRLFVQNPRPPDGIATVIAYIEGEETFIDRNGNFQYDLGEPFTDQPEPFQDRDGDGQRDNNEPFVDINNDGVHDPGNNVWDSRTTFSTSMPIVFFNGEVVFEDLGGGNFFVTDSNGLSLPAGTVYNFEPDELPPPAEGEPEVVPCESVTQNSSNGQLGDLVVTRCSLPGVLKATVETEACGTTTTYSTSVN